MISILISLAFRPYIFRELPLWGRIYQWASAGGPENMNPLWRNAPVRVARGKKHGYLMELDLSDDLDRMVYFLGRYYDIHLRRLHIRMAQLQRDFPQIARRLVNHHGARMPQDMGRDVLPVQRGARLYGPLDILAEQISEAHTGHRPRLGTDEELRDSYRPADG